MVRRPSLLIVGENNAGLRMIRGKEITLRTIREADLDALYTALSDLASRGDYFPLSLMSEATFKREFHAHGFWWLFAKFEGSA